MFCPDTFRAAGVPWPVQCVPVYRGAGSVRLGDAPAAVAVRRSAASNPSVGSDQSVRNQAKPPERAVDAGERCVRRVSAGIYFSNDAELAG